MVHKDIRIQLEIEGQRYEAVGFLHEGEPPISGHEMLARTNNESGMTEEDEEFIMACFFVKKWSKELSSYTLVTYRIHSDDVSVLYTAASIKRKLIQNRFRLDGPWDQHYLVVRRLP